MRWQDGYPCDNGSTDNADSARLAGILKVIDYQSDFDIRRYLTRDGYVRHPVTGNYSVSGMLGFSRDQSVCLFAGFHADKLPHYADAYYRPTNGDIVTPSVRGHYKRCAGDKASWFQDMWLWLDVIYSALVDPLAEPNQLICVLLTHPNIDYLKAWTQWNKQWEDAVDLYWSYSFRNEPSVAYYIKKKVRDRLCTMI